jgi:hypothetical protein
VVEEGPRGASPKRFERLAKRGHEVVPFPRQVPSLISG